MIGFEENFMLVLLQTIFWLMIGIVLYTFLGYPLLITALVRILARRVTQAHITPSVTLLIPAHNEEKEIARKLENSIALDYPPDRLEIVVVSDGSDDGTDQIVAGFSGRRVRSYQQAERQGKAAAINRVMPWLQSELVILSDVNAMLEPGSVRALVRNFADEQVGGVAGEKRVASGGEGLYWRYESYLKRCDGALRSVMGAAGELFAFRRELFKPLEADSLIDDFVISLRLVEQGWRVVYEPSAIAVENGVSTLDGEWERRARIAAGGFQSIARLTGLLNPARGLVAWQFFSHRVLRWAVTPFLLPALMLVNLALIPAPFYFFLFLAQAAFYLAAFAGYRQARRGIKRGLLYIIFFFCFTNLAALAGFWRYVRKSQPVTWSKTR